MPKVTELTEDTVVGGAELIYAVDGTSDKKVAISTIRKYIQPAGMIQMYGGSSAPTGWLFCDGSAVDREIYADLFTVIGTTWGVGNGVTTFNVPDIRGRAPIGVGTGDGLTARTLADEVGEETHQLTKSEMPSHHHTVPSEYRNSTSTINHLSGSDGSGSNHTNISTSTAGSDSAHNNMQPSIAVNFIIKT